MRRRHIDALMGVEDYPRLHHASSRKITDVMPPSRDDPSLRRDLITICLMWCLVLSILWTLERVGYPVGYGVWPAGEDRNWVSFLQNGPGSGAARLFWQMNDRNPLSPWWYIAVRGIILGWDGGLLLVTYAVRLLLAIATYLCLRGVAGAASRRFALAVACLVAATSFNGYIDDIIWDFVGALALTLLCIWAFTRFLEDGPGARNWYALSLVLWFFAFATYTLQSGALLAVGALSLLSPGPDAGRGKIDRAGRAVARAISHTWPYLALYIGFILIWRTTSNPNMAAYYETSFSVQQFFTSLRLGIWHTDYPNFLAWLVGGPFHGLDRLLTAVAVFLAAFAVLTVVPRIGGRGDRPAEPRALLRVCLVAACIAAPTVMVEASSGVWTPGLRWRMLHPFWIPLIVSLALASTALAASILPIRRGGRWTAVLCRVAWTGAVAACVAGAFLIDLGHNQIQVASTRREMAVKQAIADVVGTQSADGGEGTTHFLIRRRPGAEWTFSDALSQTYVSTWFPDRKLTLRIIPTQPAPDPGWTNWWTIDFGPDDAGVSNPSVDGGRAPYQSVAVLDLDAADHVTPLIGAKRSDFDGFSVAWNRNGPLPSIAPVTGRCGGAWDASSVGPQPGFSGAEKDQMGPFRWMVAKSAAIKLLPCPGPAKVSVEVAFALTEDTLSRLAVDVDGQAVPLSATRNSTGTLFEGRLSRYPEPRGKPAELHVTVPKLDTVAGDPRSLGVAVRSVTVLPEADTVD